MKVAVLYICTGEYSRFFKEFYDSAHQYFLKGVADVEFFVFTNQMDLFSAEDVHLFHHEYHGYPIDSLFRFDMFLSIEEELKSFDYCFFFNANMKFLAPVGREFLPEKDGLMAVLHSGYYRKPYWSYPYERNPKSKAYIPPHQKPYRYYQGCLEGGKTPLFMELSRVCSKDTHEDYDRGIHTYVDDESYMNRYMREHPCTAMSPAYAYPEGKHLPVEPIILQINKLKVSQFFHNKKGYSTSYWFKFKKGFRILWRTIRWYGKF